MLTHGSCQIKDFVNGDSHHRWKRYIYLKMIKPKKANDWIRQQLGQ